MRNRGKKNFDAQLRERIHLEYDYVVSVFGQPFRDFRGIAATERTRATIEVHHMFFVEVPQFGSCRPLPDTAVEKGKTATVKKYPMA